MPGWIVNTAAPMQVRKTCRKCNEYECATTDKKSEVWRGGLAAVGTAAPSSLHSIHQGEVKFIVFILRQSQLSWQ